MTTPPVNVTIERKGVRYTGIYTIESDVIDMITVTCKGKSKKTQAGPAAGRDALAEIILGELVTEEEPGSRH
jgi:hypothetical protein